MGRKVSPIALRLGVHRNWASRWFGGAKYAQYLRDDVAIRTFLKGRMKNMAVDSIHIDRGNNAVRVSIVSARPGLIIGRGGTGIQELQQTLAKKLGNTVPLQLEVVEVKTPDASAAVVAEHIVDQIEKRTPYRRTMRMAMTKVMASREVKGAKMQLGGRLDGSEIARVEHMEQGALPLQTLRANINFARATAHTTYGTVGVKVWIYKGDVFENQQ